MATTAWFEWGTTPALTTFGVTPSQSLGSGTTSQSVSAALTGLSPGTTYYYRVAASNAGGTVRGSIVSFRTETISAFDWGIATPASQGMDKARLDSMWNTLQTRGTKAFMVIRNDKFVYEKYVSLSRHQKHYTASMTKGLVRGMSLLVAMNDGLISPDDLAAKYVLQWATDPIKSSITVREIATHTSGMGKTLVAEIVRSLSARSDKPFVKVNCSSIPEETFELTVFGPDKELSNGMDQDALGKIGEAQGGTRSSPKSEICPLRCKGGSLVSVKPRKSKNSRTKSTVRADVRILATTNRSLQDLIHKGVFREDLYYRLNVMFIHVPPLRDRIEDLPDLVRHFIGRMNPRSETPISSISNEALSLLSSHDWPGNVRELRNVLEREKCCATGA